MFLFADSGCICDCSNGIRNTTFFTYDTEEHGLPLISLDEEIEKVDGRSVRRICMMMGEHEYRNKEYEALKNISQDAVVLCGDGVLHDDMSRDLITSHELVIVGNDMSCDELWENAKTIDDSYHAFMHFGSEEKKRATFDDLYERQRVLFTPYII